MERKKMLHSCQLKSLLYQVQWPYIPFFPVSKSGSKKMNHSWRNGMCREVCHCFKTATNQSAQVHQGPQTYVRGHQLTDRLLIEMKIHLWARAVTHCWHSACLACREPWVTPSTADPGHGGTTGTWRQSQTFKTAFSYIASLRQAWTPWDSLKK